MTSKEQDYKTPDEKTQELLREIESALKKGKKWDALTETWRSLNQS